jgi:hypothetical protein
VGRNRAVVFSALWHKEAFHEIGVQEVAWFDSDRCSVFCLFGEERTKKKREAAGAFFPYGQSRLALLAVPGRIFTAVRCN